MKNRPTGGQLPATGEKVVLVMLVDNSQSIFGYGIQVHVEDVGIRYIKINCQ